VRLGTWILAAAAASFLLVAAPSRTTFDAPLSRLVILTESSGTVGLELRGPGSEVSPIFAQLGIGGSVAMSAARRPSTSR
jgi:hypothetical protein